MGRKPTGNPRGRPGVPEADRAQRRNFTIAGPLLGLVELHIPEGIRSEIVQQAFEAELRKLGIEPPARKRKDAGGLVS